MMKSFYLIIVMVWVFFSCTREENLSTLSGTWKLTAYQQIETGAIDTEPSNLERSIEIQFSDNGSTGTISGHTVTNQISGKYALQAGNQINVESFGGTKVAEPAWGNRFWTAIYQAGIYQVNSTKLVITNKLHTEKMIFQRK
ncbi:META domain-containing protein [Rhodocytophaga rosea]|uniref:META domain-containing protein n=1 Tax=Rhodocytophaga rosea TaxID=2704465 RepID=A0A6C0GJ92_9BACT|nr:META domain-containing protein [Rhodocytophaga rosea]QHT67753.1 META domain-containing protein [Rhodocytophaga rosea]